MTLSVVALSASPIVAQTAGAGGHQEVLWWRVWRRGGGAVGAGAAGGLALQQRAAAGVAVAGVAVSTVAMLRRPYSCCSGY